MSVLLLATRRSHRTVLLPASRSPVLMFLLAARLRLVCPVQHLAAVVAAVALVQPEHHLLLPAAVALRDEWKFVWVMAPQAVQQGPIAIYTVHPRLYLICGIYFVWFNHPNSLPCRSIPAVHASILKQLVQLVKCAMINPLPMLQDITYFHRGRAAMIRERLGLPVGPYSGDLPS